MTVSDQEDWLPVAGYGERAAALYEVSNHGRVRSAGRRVDYVNVNGRTVNYWKPGRILRLSPLSKDKNYVCVHLCIGRVGGSLRKITVAVHILVLEAFAGPRPDGLAACHGDGDGRNNTPSNLRWDTYSANNYDRVAHGRHPKTHRTHCPRGHPLRDPNLEPAHAKSGHRACWSCAKALSAASRARIKGVTPPNVQELADWHYEDILARAAEPGVKRCRQGHVLTPETTIARRTHIACMACVKLGAERAKDRRRVSGWKRPARTDEQRLRENEMQRTRKARKAALAVEMAGKT